MSAPLLALSVLAAVPANAASNPKPTPALAVSATASTTATAHGTVDYGAKAAQIALTQVGVKTTPSSTSFGLDCDPYTPMVGPDIPNSNGCGVDPTYHVQNENEVWCSDFVKWAWMKAGVTADLDLINAGSNSFLAWGKAQGQPLVVDGTDPHVGDAVVFYGPGAVSPSRYADHVGIVTAVNADGTVDLVDGDFRGANGIGVEHDMHLDLKTWASAVWNKGEQWVFVSPPTARQQPAPTVHLSGSHEAIAGAPVTLHADARQRGGSITSYLWAFSDGGHATTAATSHVFGSAGLHTVALTATSNLGTVTVKTFNVMVDAASHATSSTPDTANWYAVTPVHNSVFFQNPKGALARDVFNGAEWSYEDLPAALAAHTAIAVLNYADPSAGTVQPHVFYRDADGALAETYGTATGWKTRTLPGRPAADTDIVATTRPASTGDRHSDSTTAAISSTPAVYFFGTDGRLQTTTDGSAGWSASALPVPAAGHGRLAVALTAHNGHARTTLFALDGRGDLTATSSDGRGWRTARVARAGAVDPHTPLAAITVGRDGAQSEVLFADRAGRLQDSVGSGYAWHAEDTAGLPPMRTTPQMPSASVLKATTDVTPSNTVRDDAFYVATDGRVVHATSGGRRWQAQQTGATGTALAGVLDFPRYLPQENMKLRRPTPMVGGQTETVIVAGESGTRPTLDAVTATPGTPEWVQTPLVTAPPAFASSVRLYAATDADAQTALAAAKTAGLPASQVIRSVYTAWADALDGRHLVISVGQSATAALYFNVCGWTNPSAQILGGTPFGYVVSPRTSWPGAGLYVDGLASDASQTAARVTDLAFFAVHGTLPAGVTSVPSAGSPAYACSGSAS